MSDPVAAAAKRLADAGVSSPRLDARLLWEHAKRIEMSALVARGRTEAIFGKLVARRANREPLAYITGHKEFWSLDFAVGPGVLIPRPETETLIEQMLRLVPDRGAPLAVLDLGTGSGCLLVAALRELPLAHGIGIDASAEALAWAERNIAAHKLEGRASLIETAWIEEAAPGFDIVLCNPPYVPTADIRGLEPEVERYEPRAALDGGRDGLDAYRALAPRIARLVRPGGHAFLEIGLGQDAAVADLFRQARLEVAQIAPDLAGIPRCIVVRRAQSGRVGADQKIVGNRGPNR
ncbi:MAG TPA: peptide chain release factor N(5)-glutamine methyltransferase [Rhizomicrobium sp.]|nr:peptide chain release factor N(5)-glutamine methyltransferase [Rhizomicrobium sp.]